MQLVFVSQVAGLILIMFQENLMSFGSSRETKTNNCVSYQNDTLKIESENKKWDDDGTTFAPRQSVHHKNWISI